MLARMAATKVNRRSFLATSGLLGTSAFLAACTGGGSASAAPSAAASRGRPERGGRRAGR